MARRTIKADLLPMTPENKRRLISAIAPLSGDYSISIEPRRGTRSQRANAYWWSCCAAPFAEFLSDGGIRKFSKDEAHFLIKSAVLPHVAAVNPATGEVIGEIPSDTHDMDSEAFFDFVERGRAWLASEFNLITPDPDPDWAGRKEAVRHA